jgi:hypothetical protein
MNITRVLISVMAFCIALLVGFKTGSQINLIEKLLTLSLDIASEPEFQLPHEYQFNLVIIGISDTDSSQATLESVWLAAYSEVTQKMTFMPVFPALNNPDQNQTLSKAFSLEQGKPSETFWNALRTTHLWWDGYVLSDRLATIKIVDLLDGINVNDMHLGGKDVVNNISSWRENPQLAIEKQGILLEGICDRVVKDNSLASISTWEVLFENPINSNFHTILQVAKWGSKFRENENLTCEFPVTGDKQAILIRQ